MSHPLWYTRRMKIMKETNITEAQLLLNQEVKVTSPHSQFHGQTVIVLGIMADGRTLEVALGGDKVALVDITNNRLYLEMVMSIFDDLSAD